MIREIAVKHGLSINEEIINLLKHNAVVACGVSGGKDSDVLALKMRRFLDEIGHTGEQVLIHSDLGEIEHADSLPQCKRLAEKVEMPLIVIRPLYTMLERWEKRWSDNITRYVNLSSVKLITPFSSAQWRFCTSELKTSPICQELKRRFPGRKIINAVGIRAEESPARAKKPISKENKKLISNPNQTSGYDWNAILDLKIESVWLTHQQENFQAHEAYFKNGNTRISCSCCVLATEKEIKASMQDERNHAAYRRIVELELKSTYSFSQNFWLADVCPELLNTQMLERLSMAKKEAVLRREIEAEIPAELLYVKNDFPKFQPSMAQSALIASVRDRIGDLMNLPVKCTTAQAVYDRYAYLLKLKAQKGKGKNVD